MITARKTRYPVAVPSEPPSTNAPKANGLRWILSINTALWGIIIAGFWIIG